MVWFITLIFILITFYGVAMIESVSSKKTRDNTVEAPFCILGASTEPDNNWRVKPIVESEIWFFFENVPVHT